MAIIQWNKRYTETLNETLKRFRKEKQEFNDEKVTYAGRLDPMAEGLVILLTGDDVYKKNDFLNMDKVYMVDFIFGLETDTYDILGILNKRFCSTSFIDEDLLMKVLKKNIGIFNQKYPPYSSKPVNGKPLFAWARENKLNEIIIPTKEVEIYSIEYLGKKKIIKDDFKKYIIKNIKAVNGDFRQNEILDRWKDYFIGNKNTIMVYSIKVEASSGAYMRSLIHKIGQAMNKPSISVKIKRIRVGKYYK